MLVTAGGTREPIDAVRYVGNRSSRPHGLRAGRGGRGARRRGDRRRRQRRAAARTRASATSTSRPPRELQAACEAQFAGGDVLLMAAAVADFRPAAAADGKIKKTGRDELDVALERTEDILSRARRHAAAPGRRSSASPPSTATGALDYGRGKLARKGLDAVVVNDVARQDIGFDTPDNEVTIVTAAGDERRPARGEGRGRPRDPRRRRRPARSAERREAPR